MRRPDIEWQRFRWKLPKSKAEVELIREIVMNNYDSEFMELKPN